MSLAKDLKSKLSEVESYIRDSRWVEAQEALNSLRRVKLSAEEAIHFASLCRRANLPGMGLSVLRALVRPTSRKKIEATPHHLIEYAACLIRLGATREAEGVLAQVDFEKNPTGLPFKAFIHIKEWDYDKAIPWLRKHLAHVSPGSYESTVSKLNLSMSLIFEEQFTEAAEILNQIITLEENFKHKLLKGNCYRLLGNLEFGRENFEFAMQAFQKAYHVFSESQGIDSFLVRKWIVLTQYHLQQGNAVARVAVDTLREEALMRKHWESVRDIDYQLASFHKDQELLVKLHFGTSLEKFKKRLEKKFPNLSLPTEYLWRIGEKKTNKAPIFDIAETDLKPGQSLHRIISVLTSDFYKSFSTMDIFQAIHPGEFYSFGHSEQRVYQSNTRLRKCFDDWGTYLVIDSNDNSFKLSSTHPVDVRIRRVAQSIRSQRDFRIEELKRVYGTKSFTVQDVMKILQLGRRTANDVLKGATDSKQLLRLGAGSSTRYQILDCEDGEFKKAS